MTHRTDRRRFLSAAGGLGLLAALPRASARPRAQEQEEAPLYRISLAQWSLHRALRGGELSHAEFPAFTRERFDLDAVEYVSTFFPGGATDLAALRELRARADDAGVESLLVMVDVQGHLGDEDATRRRLAIRDHVPWIVATALLGGHSIRVNAHGAGTRDEVAKRVADSLARLAELGEPYGISVIVENHGGYSSDGGWLAGVIEAAGMEAAGEGRVGTLPDFGNFHLGGGEQYDRYQGVRELMPYARAVSAKSHEFDAEGNEVHTDYRRMMAIVRDAGYRGYVGIEYEGSQHSEVEGVRLTRDLLLRVRDELARS